MMELNNTLWKFNSMSVVQCCSLIIFGLITFVTVLIVGGTEAKTISVDDDGGSDFTKIQNAVDSASYGDTIHVQAGTYTENVIINKRGLTIIGEGAGNTTIDVERYQSPVIIDADRTSLRDFTLTGNGLAFPVLHVFSNNNSLENITFTNFGNRALYLEGADNNLVSNITVHESSHYINAIYLGGSHGTTIVHSTIIKNPSNHGDLKEAIRICNSENTTLYENSLINSGIAILGEFIDWTTLTIAENNTINNRPIKFMKNEQDGTISGEYGAIIVANCTNVTIIDNTISNTTEAILVGYSSQITIVTEVPAKYD